MRPHNLHFYIARILASLMPILLLGLVSDIAFADNWIAPVYENSSPAHLVGVDKKKRIFNLFEKNSPLRLRYSYPCVTGQLPGDKQQLNDLRTPEGIYFVEYKIANGLDFREYGGVAYTLNYPNPVDRLRGKTGYGIWIHSKGFELVPTKGCVAIDRKNIAEVGPMLVPGTPVVLAEELKEIARTDNGTLDTLKDLMREWSNTWSSRSNALFDYYDPVAYTAATENFDAFRLNKERLFKLLTFIKIYNREIHALEGPGYWVTWAEQLYTASNLATEGVRRLYWQKGNNGEFKIVGMEWIPRDVGMHAEFKKGKLVAEGPAPVSDETASEIPVAPRLDMPEQSPQAVLAPVPEQTAPVKDQDNPDNGLFASISSLANRLLAISEPLVPKRQSRSNEPDEITWGKGKKMTEETPDIQREPTPQLNLPGRVYRHPDLQKNKPVKTESPKKTPIVLTEAELAPMVDLWLQAYREQDTTLLDLYDRAHFNRLPANLGITRRLSLETITRMIKHDLAAPWFFVIANEPKISVKDNLGKVQFDLMLIGPQGSRKGVQNQWWQKDENGEILLVGSDFMPAKVDLDAKYLDLVSKDIGKMIEGWRLAWEGAQLEDYMSYYYPNATQGARAGIKPIRRNKELLWNQVKPVQVQFSGMRLTPDKDGIRADMTQIYSDNAGKNDKGIKTVLLRFDGNRWLIQKEDWVATP